MARPSEAFRLPTWSGIAAAGDFRVREKMRRTEVGFRAGKSEPREDTFPRIFVRFGMLVKMVLLKYFISLIFKDSPSKGYLTF